MPVPVRQAPSGTWLVGEVAVQPSGRVVAYCRVSSADQKADLERQAARVVSGANGLGLAVAEVVTEVGSGLNGRRRKLHRLLSDPQRPVVAVLSGGNVDPVLMERVLRHGMAAQGRHLAVRLRLTDRPGALASLLGVLSVVDANVLDVGHVRTNPRLGLTEAEVELHLETKGPAHCAEVQQALRDAGYSVMG
ncbi:recombinase family protein [Streptomyces sp. DSM 41972]|uniref:Recombinase family protein n=1 Tax=Streptomyces althioticus subsp. attaecolombicae TaxID=3075534 RepID=A0ABU3HZB1_9ACTN|nr:recombinase family protein [Streptomyces sp. DSM 41972]